MADQAEYRHDVFISHADADRAWVEGELLQRLKDSGLRVCTERDFERGAPRLTEVERAVKSSSKTLLILTPAYLESEWAEFASLMVQTLDLGSRERRLIPLLKAKCDDLPLRFRQLTAVDFTEPEERQIAWTQLLTALGVPPVQEPPEESTREEWHLVHPYPMSPNFTGRAAEQEMLSQWLNTDTSHPLLVLRALGGFGKSALTWHWLMHDVEPARWLQVVWWSFYESNAGFDSFLQETLTYLSGNTLDLRSLGPRQQADELLRRLHQPGVLLILDGFERALRAYSGIGAAYQGDEPVISADDTEGENQRDCVSPIAEHFLRSVLSLPGIRGRILMTTRLRLRVLQGHGGDLLQGCREETLTQMQPADAVAFFQAQGIRGNRAEIEQACEPYGYHPLSLRLLAGLIVNDLQQPGDIAAARRLDVSGDLLQRRHHVLEQAYKQLTPPRRQLLSRIACFRGAVNYNALRALTQGEEDDSVFDAALRDLLAHGLLQHDRRANRYDLHPIVHRYAYDQLNDNERSTIHSRLRDYFAAVPTPEQVQSLGDLAPVIELYHHTVRAGQYDEAVVLLRDRIAEAVYYQFGAYQLQIQLLYALFPNGEDQPPRLTHESDQAWVLNELGIVYAATGQPRQAMPLVEKLNTTCKRSGNMIDLLAGLLNLAGLQLRIGALRAVETNLRQEIATSRKLRIRRTQRSWPWPELTYREALGHLDLGRVLTYRGLWRKAEAQLGAALVTLEKIGQLQAQGSVWAYRSLRGLLLARLSVLFPATLPKGQTVTGVVDGALAAARRAMELAEETSRTHYPVERDYVRVHWLLGTAYRVNGATPQADYHLSEALTRCRRINSVDQEPDTLLDLARLRAATGERSESLRLAQEALIIIERSGYVLQGADVHLFLAQMALEDRDKEMAVTHARQARRLATCDGPPDYTYKVAYDEAGALLEHLGEKA